METTRWIRSRSGLSPGYTAFSLFFAALALALVVCCKSKSQSSAEESAAAPPDSLELVFVYGSEKEKWIAEVTSKFNSEDHRAPGGKRIYVRAIPLGSGECIDQVLDGTRKAHLVSPASAAFIKLGNARSQSQSGHELIGATENLVLSPVVIAM